MAVLVDEAMVVSGVEMVLVVVASGRSEAVRLPRKVFLLLASKGLWFLRSISAARAISWLLR